MDLKIDGLHTWMLCHYCHKVIGEMSQFRTIAGMPKGTCAHFEANVPYGAYKFSHEQCHQDHLLLSKIASVGVE